MNEQQQSKIQKLLDKNEFCVIATNAVGRAPESAVVAISNTADFQLIFATFKSSRKYANIAQDNKVSIVVGWDNVNKQTMQVEGVAQPVPDEARMLYEDIHCKKNPNSERFRGNVQQKYFTIRPTWIRYSDFSANPPEVWEILL